MRAPDPRFASIRSSLFFDAPEAPPIPNRKASTRVDLPLPRGPIMQVSPAGKDKEKPGRKPPLISMDFKNHLDTSVPPKNLNSYTMFNTLIKALQDSGVVIIGRLLLDVNFSDVREPVSYWACNYYGGD